MTTMKPAVRTATRPLIGTSWKMNLTSSEAVEWFRVARPLLEPLAATRDLFVLPPFPSLWVARDALAGSGIGWGGQDLHPAESGPHTGDVSAAMLADLGCTYVEIGHSERRRDHGETDTLVAAKVRTALQWSLIPIVCIGEAVHGGIADAWRVVRDQLERGLGGVGAVELDRLVVAYEPVWAIGDGAMAAEPEHVAAVHVAIVNWLIERGASAPRVLYGGSVDEAAASELLACDGVAGLFVGRAALDPRRFAAIAGAAIADRRMTAATFERTA